MISLINILAERSSQPVLIVLYWILLILLAIGGLAPIGEPYRANVLRGTSIVGIILFAIVGYYLFGSPAN